MMVRPAHFSCLELCSTRDASRSIVKVSPMQVPVWTKPALLGAVAGALGLSMVGFWLLGWQTARSAELFAQDRADTAAVAALVPFCVAKAQQDPDKAVLAKLRTENSAFTRGDMVTHAGWATVGGDASPNDALAIACSDKLRAAKSS